jgi:hypothetical protein
MHGTGRQIAIWLAIRIGRVDHRRRQTTPEVVRVRMRRSKLGPQALLMPQALFMPQALPLQRTPRQGCRRALRGKAICVRRA